MHAPDIVQEPATTLHARNQATRATNRSQLLQRLLANFLAVVLGFFSHNARFMEYLKQFQYRYERSFSVAML
jgi:hypothetical protein